MLHTPTDSSDNCSLFVEEHAERKIGEGKQFTSWRKGKKFMISGVTCLGSLDFLSWEPRDPVT